MKLDEHAHQTLLFEWIQYAKITHPELEYFHAIPNGAKMPYSRDRNGNRYCLQAQRMKKEGLKRGVPDTCLPVPRASYHGLYLEMKAESGKPTPEQKDYIRFLNSQGFFACLAVGFDDAKAIVEWYINLPAFSSGAEVPEIPNGAVRFLD